MKMRSVNTAIALLIAVSMAVSVLAAVLWVNHNTRQTVFNEGKESMNNMVAQTMAALDDYISQTDEMARMLASQQSVAEALAGRDALPASWLFKDLMSTSKGYWAAFAFDRNGKVVAGYNAKGQDMAGADRSSREYVKAVLSGKSDHFLSNDILISKSGGGILIFAAASAVRDHTGEIVGGVGLFPRWENFTSKFIDPFRVAGSGYAYMLDLKGRMIAHAMNKDLYLEDMSGQEFAKVALGAQKGETTYMWEGREKYMVFDTAPKTGWKVVMSAYEDDLAAAAHNQRNKLAAGGAVLGVLLVCILVFAVRRTITNPVKNILEFASEVAGGNLQARLEGKYKFEFRSLAAQIETMVHELKVKLGFSEGVLGGIAMPCALVGEDHKLLWVNRQMCDLLMRPEPPESYIGVAPGEFFYGEPDRKTLSDRAVEQQQRLDNEVEYARADGSVVNVQVISTPFYDMDGQLLGSLTIWFDVTEIRGQQKLIEEQNERISVAAGQAQDISQSLSSAAEQLSAQMEEGKRGSEDQRARAAETASAMEQMNASVLDVARNASQASEVADEAKSHAQRGEEMVNQVIEAVGEVQAQTEGLRQSMEGLGSEAEDIGNVLGVITDIADQTNLLALNAAIESSPRRRRRARLCGSGRRGPQTGREDHGRHQRGGRRHPQDSGDDRPQRRSHRQSGPGRGTEHGTGPRVGQGVVGDRRPGGNRLGPGADHRHGRRGAVRHQRRDQPGHGRHQQHLHGHLPGHAERQRGHPGGGRHGHQTQRSHRGHGWPRLISTATMDSTFK